MARIKRGLMRHKRHRKIVNQASGYFGRKGATFKHAHEQVMKSGQYAFRDRRAKKRDFRRQWIVRISAACRLHGVRYSEFISAMTKQGVAVNRKMLSELAIADPGAFEKLLKQTMSSK